MNALTFQDYENETSERHRFLESIPLGGAARQFILYDNVEDRFFSGWITGLITLRETLIKYLIDNKFVLILFFSLSEGFRFADELLNEGIYGEDDKPIQWKSIYLQQCSQRLNNHKMRETFENQIHPIPQDKSIQLPGDFNYFSELLSQDSLKSAVIVERLQNLIPCEQGSVITQQQHFGIVEAIQYWSSIGNEKRMNKNISFLICNLPVLDTVPSVLRNSSVRSGVEMINVPLPETNEIEASINLYIKAGMVQQPDKSIIQSVARFLYGNNLRTITGWIRALHDDNMELTVQNIKGLINPSKNAWSEIMESRSQIMDRISKEIIGQNTVKEKLKKLFENICDKLTLEQKIVSKGDKAPLGFLFFAGPTGVGKTEVVRIIAREIEGKKIPFRKIQMTEYRESHSISRFIGAPPGYVGYGKGELGNFLFANQHRGALLLFDEFEKAHPQVQTLFLTMLEGSLTTGDGMKLDLGNCLIVFTSNAGAKELRSSLSQFDQDHILNENKKIIKNALMEAGAPIELIGRLMTAIIPFSYLTEEDAEKIIRKNIERIMNEFYEIRNIKLYFDTSIERFLIDIFRENKTLGARNLVNHVEGVFQDLSVLFKQMKGNTTVGIYIDDNKHIKWLPLENLDEKPNNLFSYEHKIQLDLAYM